MKNHTSIGHLTIREQQALLSLKNKIVALCQPLIIYLIGSGSSTHSSRNCFAHPRNSMQWHFSCDLLLVLPRGVRLPESLAEAVKDCYNDHNHIRLIAHPFDFVEKQIREHSLFFCWMQRRAIVLYERDQSCQKLPEPGLSMKQYEKQAQQFFKDHPDYHNYTEVKLSPLPVKPPRPFKVNPAGKSILVDLIKTCLEYAQKPVADIGTTSTEYRRAVQAGIPTHFKEMLWSFIQLTELLDVAEGERTGTV